MNLDNTLAVTQNFVSKVNFNYVWRALRADNPSLSSRFYLALEATHPELHQQAKEINHEDNFVKPLENLTNDDSDID